MSTNLKGTISPRKPSPFSIWFLMIWHAVFSGAFFVAILTEKGAYHAHVFAGTVVIITIGVRLLVGMAIPKGHVLTFPLPAFTTLKGGSNGVRRFLSHLLGVLMLVVCGLATLTGWFANSETTVTAHGAVSYFALALIAFHIVQVMLFSGWKRLEGPPQPKKNKPTPQNSQGRA